MLTVRTNKIIHIIFYLVSSMAYATFIMPEKAMIDAAGVCTTFKGIIMIKDRMIAFIFTLSLMLPIEFLGCSGGSNDSIVSSVSPISSIGGCVIRFFAGAPTANGLSAILVPASLTYFHLPGGCRPQSTSFRRCDSAFCF